MIQRYYRPARLISVLTAVCFLLLWFGYLRDISLTCNLPVVLRNFNESQLLELRQQGEQRPLGNLRSKIAKVTVATNVLDSPLIDRALRTHKVQNDIHGYAHLIAVNQAVSDLIENDPKHRPQGAWTKPAYLLAILVDELQKPEAERLEWLFWFDADTIVTNPNTPLEIFLPPADQPELENIKMLMASNWDGLNSGAFALRVHPWSVSLLSAVLAYPIYKAENLKTDRFRDQSAFQWLLTKDESPLVQATPLAGREHWAEIPMRWFNSLPFNNAFNKSGSWIFANNMTDETFEGGTDKVYDDGKGPKVQRWKVMRGDMIVHFAGSTRVRDSWMGPWLDRTEAMLPEWANATTQELLREEATAFWQKTARDRTEMRSRVKIVTVTAGQPAEPTPAEPTPAKAEEAGVHVASEAPPIVLGAKETGEQHHKPRGESDPGAFLVDRSASPPHLPQPQLVR